MPADMREWLPEQHRAWMVLAVVRMLDLSRFRAAYRADGKGQAPYDPGMMVAVIWYCALKGITSTRGLRDACTDDVGARLIAGGTRPSNKTWGEFKTRHREALRGLSAQILALLRAEGVIGEDDEVTAIDGTPASTAAALGSNMTPAQLEEKITGAGQRAAAELEAWAAANAAAGTQQALWEEDDGGDSPAAPPGSGRKLAAALRTLARLEAARAKAAERAASPDGQAAEAVTRAQARAEKAAARAADAGADADAKMARWQQYQDAGKAWPYGNRPVPAASSARVARARKDAAAAAARLEAAIARAAVPAPVRVSATDPDSRILPGKNGGWVQGINFQASAGRSQVLYATAIHDSPADAGALLPMLRATDAACDTAGIPRKTVKLADCGYASEENFTALAGGGHGQVLVAVRKEAVQAGRRGPAGTRPVPGPWHDMAGQLAQPAARQLYKKRGQYIEPFFAQLFQLFTRRIPYRGTPAIHAELTLRGQAHNLAKLFTHWTRTARPIPAA